MKSFAIKGLIAAPLTPMHDNGDINYEAIEKYVDILVEQDVFNVYVNGTNGEGLSLTTDERKKTLEVWIEKGKNKLNNVIAQVGSTSLWETKELARHAQLSGADGIGVISPIFFKPSTVDQLVLYLIEVSRVCPELPMLYYHFPDVTGLKLPLVNIVEECVKKVPTFCGVKYTDYDLLAFGRCLLNKEYGSKLTMAYGRDEQLVGALMLGADVGVGGTYNYAGKIYSRMFEAVKAGDMEKASELQIQSQKLIDVFLKHGFDIGVNKSVMEMITGLKCGPPRLPLLPASTQHVEAIQNDLKNIGFFDFRK